MKDFGPLMFLTIIALTFGVSINFALAACATNGWADADTKGLQDAYRAQMQLREVCEGDGGALCSPALVRAVERSSTCNLASMLHRHGADVPDGGEGCTP